jgi:hypothetical protein
LLGRRVLSKDMRLRHLTKSTKTLYGFSLAALLILSGATMTRSEPPSPKVVEMFPLDLGGFHQLPTMRALVTLSKEGDLQPEFLAPNSDPNNASPFLGAEVEYLSADGDKFLVEIVRLQGDSGAYSLLTLAAKKMKAQAGSQDFPVGDVGTASLIGARSVMFFSGQTFARVTNESKNNPQPAIALARLLAATFDKGEDDVPVLVKHLPEWQAAQRSAVYAVNIGALRDAITNQPILNELTFEGGTEAVVANYGQAQLVIVEFTTPQFSVDNDQRILARIQELKSQGHAIPTAYRRVGNYSVFVFNAPDEKTANELIDQVKYQQVVQWLGDDPHLAARLQRYISQTTAGVLTAVLKSSGLSLLLCLGLGGLIGTLLFRHRRAQKATLYSDAGGATRLNLDELTGVGNSHRLLGPGTQPKSDSTQS